MNHLFTWSARENRLVHMGNMETWFNDTSTTYVQDPVNNGDPVKTGLGAGMFVTSTVLEAPDYFFATIAGQDLQAPSNVTFSRTRRDMEQLFTDVTHVRPVGAFLDVVRLATTDVPMDGVDTVFGYKHTGPRAVSNETRSRVASSLS